jgi:hypothetical protein
MTDPKTFNVYSSEPLLAGCTEDCYSDSSGKCVFEDSTLHGCRGHPLSPVVLQPTGGTSPVIRPVVVTTN